MARLVRNGEAYGLDDISDAEALTLAEICIEGIVTIIRSRNEYPHVIELLARVATEVQLTHQVKDLSEEDFGNVVRAIKIYQDPAHTRQAVRAYHQSIERRMLLNEQANMLADRLQADQTLLIPAVGAADTSSDNSSVNEIPPASATG